jgi:hypothetical protein
MALRCRFLIVLTLLPVCSGLGFAQDTTTVPPDSAGPGPVVEPTSFSPTSFTNVHVSQDPTGHFQGEPTIAINPRDPSNLAAAWIDYRLDNRPAVATSYSVDGGLSWAEATFIPHNIGGFPGQGDPVLSADNDGNFYLVFISGVFSYPYYGGVWVAKSADGGASWPETLFRRLDNDLTFDDKPWIIVDRINPASASYVYVGWSHGLTQEIWFARSTDGGETFQSDTLSSIARGAQFGTSFAIGPNGNLYVAWRARVSTQTYIFFTKSTDAGVTFEPERQIFPCRGSAFINRLERVFVFPYLAVNSSSGTLYMTWNDAFTSDSLDTTDVFFSRSIDEGQTWSQPINIFNNLPIPAKAPNDQFFPFVVVSPEGEQVSVMYYDRADFPNNDSMHVKVSISTDDGVSFMQPVRITNHPSDPRVPPFNGRFFGDYNGMVADPSVPGKVYLVWADSRYSNPDIFMSPANIPITATVSTPVANGWQTLSVPVVVPDFAKTAVWPTSISNAFAFVPTGYEVRTMLENGIGYFIKFGAAQNIVLGGDVLQQHSIAVNANWNLVGSISSTIPVATNLCLFPAWNKFLTPFYVFNADVGYVQTDSIIAGRGHWVKIAETGSLLFSSTPIQCDAGHDTTAPIAEENYDHFTITDAQGKNQDLYVANLTRDPALEHIDLSMPPPFPGAEFDARFEQGEFIKTVSPDSGVVELVINVETESYPVTVSWELNPENGIEYSIITEGMGKSTGSGTNSRLARSGSAVMTTASARKFRMSAQATGRVTSNLPSEYSLAQNYPNPFNPETRIHFELPEEGHVRLVVYDLLGREVTMLVNESRKAGKYDVTFSAPSLSTGVYFYRLQAGTFNDVKKLLLLR